MRPNRFEAFLLDTLKNTPSITRVQTLAEAGDTKHPHGVAVTGPGGETRWQILGQLADGERHAHDEQPVEGQPAVWADAAPADGPVAFLAAAIGRAECPEIARIEPFKESASEGVICFFHNGARAYVRKL